LRRDCNSTRAGTVSIDSSVIAHIAYSYSGISFDATRTSTVSIKTGIVAHVANAYSIVHFCLY
jgi:hypothetical protein